MLHPVFVSLEPLSSRTPSLCVSFFIPKGNAGICPSAPHSCGEAGEFGNALGDGDSLSRVHSGQISALPSRTLAVGTRGTGWASSPSSALTWPYGFLNLCRIHFLLSEIKAQTRSSLSRFPGSNHAGVSCFKSRHCTGSDCRTRSPQLSSWCH